VISISLMYLCNLQVDDLISVSVVVYNLISPSIFKYIGI